MGKGNGTGEGWGEGEGLGDGKGQGRSQGEWKNGICSGCKFGPKCKCLLSRIGEIKGFKYNRAQILCRYTITFPLNFF